MSHPRVEYMNEIDRRFVVPVLHVLSYLIVWIRPLSVPFPPSCHVNFLSFSICDFLLSTRLLILATESLIARAGVQQRRRPDQGLADQDAKLQIYFAEKFSCFPEISFTQKKLPDSLHIMWHVLSLLILMIIAPHENTSWWERTPGFFAVVPKTLPAASARCFDMHHCLGSSLANSREYCQQFMIPPATTREVITRLTALRVYSRKCTSRKNPSKSIKHGSFLVVSFIPDCSVTPLTVFSPCRVFKTDQTAWVAYIRKVTGTHADLNKGQKAQNGPRPLQNYRIQTTLFKIWEKMNCTTAGWHFQSGTKSPCEPV